MADKAAIFDYIFADSPHAALHVNDEIERMADSLPEYAYRGRSGRLKATRELVLAKLPYVLIYRVDREAVVVLRVLHSAQNWPPDP